MNKDLENYARETLKENLSKCTDTERGIFKLMYAPLASADDIDINDVVDRMRVDKLDWAMQQVQRTIDNKK